MASFLEQLQVLLCGEDKDDKAKEEEEALGPLRPPPGCQLMHPTFGYAHNMVHGIVYPPFADEGAIDLLREVDWSKDGDVLIATYPKCGTTWMQQIVLSLLHQGQRVVGDPMEESPWIDRESSLLGHAERLRTGDLDISQPADTVNQWISGFENVIEQFDSKKPRRCFKTHAPYHLLPCGNNLSKGKIIVVSRNPKDTALSMYSHYRGLPAFCYRGDWSHFFDELFLNGKVGHGDYFEHIRGWAKAYEQFPDKILWLTFEELKLNVPKGVQLIADFLDIPTTPELIAKVAESASFEAMKQAHQKRIQAGKQRMGSSNHFRSGTSGGWKGAYSEEQSEKLDTLFLEQMADINIVTNFGNGLRFRANQSISDDDLDTTTPNFNDPTLNDNSTSSRISAVE